MTENKLKLNDVKTEVIVIVPAYHMERYSEMEIYIEDATLHT